MKKFILFIFTLSLFHSFVKAQILVDTPNLNFHDGSFNNWSREVGYYNYNPTDNTYYYSNWTPVSGAINRFDIFGNINDEIVACDLQKSPLNKNAARIGVPKALERRDQPNGAAAEKLTYSFKVTQNTTLLSYKLAAVLNVPDDTSHFGNQLPAFEVQIEVKDNVGNVYRLPCSTYKSKAYFGNPLLIRNKTKAECKGSDADIPEDYQYQPWITGNVNLSEHVGDSVTIIILNHDCLSTSGDKLHAGAHEAYGYFWAETQKIELEAFSCTDSVARIKAPEGFISYKWTRSDNIPISSTSGEITVEKALNINGIEYTCEMINDNSMCGSISASTIVKQVQINPSFSSVTTDAGKIEFTDKSTASGDSIIGHYWDFGDGKAGSIETNPIHQYTEYKTFEVKLRVTTKNGCNQLISQLVTPNQNLTVDLVPTDTTLYNGQTKNYKAINMSIAGLVQGTEYYLVYINQNDTTKKSFSAPSAVGSYIVRFELSPLVAYKYKMDSVPFKRFTITPAPLTVYVNNLTKTYGEKITLQTGGFTQSMNPLYTGDIITGLVLSCNGISDTASVDTDSISPTKAIGLGLENYDITFVKGTLTIKPKLLIIAAIDNSKTYGDQINPTGKEFYISPGSLVGEDTVTSVSLQCSGFDKLATVGTPQIVPSAAVGSRLSNYTISYKPATMLVKKKKITVTAKKLTKVYGTPYTFTGKEYDTDLTQFVGSDSISHVKFNSMATPLRAIVGNHNISFNKDSISGYRIDNYEINPVNSLFEVKLMPVRIIANDKTKEYSDVLALSGSEFTTDKPLISGDTILFVSLKSEGCIQTASIRKYDIQASLPFGAGISNYDFSYINGTLNVIKKKLDPSITPPDNLSYNAKNKEFTATIKEFKTRIDMTNLLLNEDYCIRYTNKSDSITQAYNSIIAPSEAGNYTATFELINSSLLKYELDSTSTVTQDFTITKTPLTITIDDQVKTYGDNMNLNVLKYAFKTDMKPLWGNDWIDKLEIKCVGLSDTASVGNYEIKADSAIGGGLKNYRIKFNIGNLAVKPKALLVKALDVTKVYGESIIPTGKEFYVDANSLVGNDTVLSVNLQSDGYVASSAVGAYHIKVLNVSGRRLNNYLISSVPDATLQLLQKKITVTVVPPPPKIYGTEYVFTGKEFSTDISQFVGKDSIYSIEFTSKGTEKTSEVNDYEIKIVKITGNGLQNYDIQKVYNPFKVDPMPITIIANNNTKKYGDLFTFNGTEFTTDKPLVNGDSILFVVLKSDGCTEAAPVREYKIFASKVYCDGLKNYIFSYQSGALSVVKKTLSAKIKPPSNLVYDAQSKEFTATVSIAGLEKNEDYFIRYTNKAGTYNNFTAPSTVGDYTASFELSGLSALKYTMDTIPLRDFTISKAPLTITADNATKTYGEKLNLLNDAFKVDMKPLFGSDAIFGVYFDCEGLVDTASVKNYQISPLSVIGSGIENYDIRYQNGTLTVNPKQLTVKAVDGTKTYGDMHFPNAKSFYVDARDLVANDMVTSVTLVSDGFNSPATTGSYPIKASNAVGIRMNNYLISYADGNLQVLKKKINVSAKSIFKVYGSQYVFRGTEFESLATQFVGSDKLTGVLLNSTGAQTKASVGEYTLSITGVSGDGMDNYDITLQNGILFVTPKPIVVIGKDLVKEYGDVLTFSGNEFTTDIPMLNNDTISFTFLRSNGSVESAPIGLYDIIPAQASGAGSLNYNISYRPGKLTVIEKQLLVTAQSCVKEYGENDPEKKFSVVDKRGVEYLPSMFTGNVAREPGEKVGVYAITKGTLSVSPSYAYTFTNGMLTIKKALPTIDPYFKNNAGQFILADVFGTKNGDYPQGDLNIKIKDANIDNTIAVNNGTAKELISGLPNQMVEAEFNYLGDDNYLPTTKTLNIYAIIYHSNGGKLVSPITNFDGNESVKLETPTQDNNYKFEGWYENEDFSGIEIRRIPISTYHDVHLYAKWSATYDDLSIVMLFNQVLAVANPLNRDFIYKSTYKWYKDGVLLESAKQYCGFEKQVPTGNYRAEIYYLNNAPIVLEYNHSATMQKSRVYPNPLMRNAKLTLYSELFKPDEVSVEVYNSFGVRQTSVTVERDKEKFMLDGFVSTGIYIIRLVQNGSIKESYKVIVEE